MNIVYFYFFYQSQYIIENFLFGQAKMQLQPQSSLKSSLPIIKDQKYLRDQVTRLIRNKIEPLSFKQYILKSGRYKIKSPQQNNTLNISINKSLQITEQRSQRYTSKKQNIENTVNLKNVRKKTEKSQNKKNNTKRRKAIVELGHFVLDKKRLRELQEKVQRHVILKKMDLMENQYAYAEECNKKMKEEVCHKLSTSPLQKYLEMFAQNQKPSQKIRRVQQQATCEQMLKQIKSAKSIKHIEIIQQNMRNLFNINDNANPDDSSKTTPLCSLSALDPMPADPAQLFSRKQIPKQIKKSKKVLKLGTQIAYTEQNVKRHNNKLRKQIMNDIKKEYENQGSPKIRMSINHRKMIQLT